jgi:hypothetical protein
LVLTPSRESHVRPLPTRLEADEGSPRERGEGVPRITVRTLEAITRALEDGGIAFVRENTVGGLGVRLRQR